LIGATGVPNLTLVDGVVVTSAGEASVPNFNLVKGLVINSSEAIAPAAEPMLNSVEGFDVDSDGALSLLLADPMFNSVEGLDVSSVDAIALLSDDPMFNSVEGFDVDFAGARSLPPTAALNCAFLVAGFDVDAGH